MSRNFDTIRQMNVGVITKKGYGDFGNLSKNYDKARKGFPIEAIEYIFEKIGKEKPHILDIGCGTGIATEQLFEKGADVIGTDVDAEMIRQAESDNRYHIEYQVAPVEKQPFEDNLFDAVTTFSAFHWFVRKDALEEIRRVLKPSGFFFAINKNEIGDFKKKNKEILRQFIEQEMPDVKKEYDPKKALKDNGFQSVEERVFPFVEYFNLEEAVGYIQTMSVWNLVRDDKRNEVLEKLSEHFRQTMKEGVVERRLEIKVVLGISF